MAEDGYIIDIPKAITVQDGNDGRPYNETRKK